MFEVMELTAPSRIEHERSPIIACSQQRLPAAFLGPRRAWVRAARSTCLRPQAIPLVILIRKHHQKILGPRRGRRHPDGRWHPCSPADAAKLAHLTKYDY